MAFSSLRACFWAELRGGGVRFRVFSLEGELLERRVLVRPEGRKRLATLGRGVR